ncbi:MAG: thiamine pyrophosphate-binding protein [Cyanobacteriota bacterium]
MTEQNTWNVGKYLLYRLEQLGLKDIFGVPGDFNLVFLDQIIESNIKLISTCNELNAGYAADGYARINNIGALAVTYAVGGLSAANALAGAFAEDVPVVMISGSPAVRHHERSSMLHHTLGDYNIVRDMFEKITISSILIKDSAEATKQIDKALLSCYMYKKPVYIEIPVDMFTQECDAPGEFEIPQPYCDEPEKLNELVEKTVKWLTNCQNPAILLGSEVNKYCLHDRALELIEKSGYPFATMVLDKSVSSEEHPQFIGYYEGAFSLDYVKERIENSCSVLCLGTLMTDANLGWNTAKLSKEQLIIASRGKVSFGGKIYTQISLKSFIEKLFERLPEGSLKKYDVKPAIKSYYSCRIEPFEIQKDKKLSIKRFFERMTCFIQKNDIVIADVGTALFGISQMLMPEGVIFIDQSYYCSIGYSVGATLGAAKAAPNRRTIAFIGDGAFQMTAQEVSTMIKEGLNPIIFLVNNDGYTIERYIHDGPYNDIQPWKYHKLPEIFGNSYNIEVKTELELEKALKEARNYNGLAFIELHFDKWDSTEALKSMLEMYK